MKIRKTHLETQLALAIHFICLFISNFVFPHVDTGMCHSCHFLEALKLTYNEGNLYCKQGYVLKFLSEIFP
jgi:hypothetical protein